jgi:putative phosphoribosyl transferase
LRGELDGSAGRFADRAGAGRVLAELVSVSCDLPRPVVVALPRGGVAVGVEVARRLGCPLVVFPVGKIGAPGSEELAVGAVAPGGVRVINDDVVAAMGLAPEQVEQLAVKALAKVDHQVEIYKGAEPVPLEGRSVVVVDDGLATGATMRAALAVLRQQKPRRLVLAVPVAPQAALARFSALVDEEACPARPLHMEAVGAWYDDFEQMTDEDVAGLLERFVSERADEPRPAG